MLFVSYARLDAAIALPLVDTLEQCGIACWLDLAKIPVGRAFVARLGHALRSATHFLFIDTPNGRSSYWARREVGAARRLYATGEYRALIQFAPAEAKVLDGFVPMSSTADVVAHLTRAPVPGPAIDRSAPPPAVAIEGGQPDEIDGWVGRQRELEFLDDWWRSGPRAVWIGGMGGMGKSGVLATWLAALREIGYEVDEEVLVHYLPGRTLDRATLESSWFRTADAVRKLVVVDGLDETADPAVAHALIEEMELSQVRWIVTSRAQPRQPQDRIAVLQVDGVTEDDCIALLRAKGISQSAAGEIARAVGHHPLTANLAGSLVARGYFTEEDLLRHLRQDAAWEESISTVQAVGELALARLSPEARKLLNTICKTHDQRPLHDSAPLQELVAAGLANIDATVHPLVRRLALDEL